MEKLEHTLLTSVMTFLWTFASVKASRTFVLKNRQAGRASRQSRRIRSGSPFNKILEHGALRRKRNSRSFPHSKNDHFDQVLRYGQSFHLNRRESQKKFFPKPQRANCAPTNGASIPEYSLQWTASVHEQRQTLAYL